MRYNFIKHPAKDGWYQVTDTMWGLVCEFEAGKFNETQSFPDMGTLPMNADTIANAMRELGEWVSYHHYSEAMPATVYELRLTDEDTKLHVIRHKAPHMDAVFDTDDLPKIADALAKAAEFIRKRKGGKR
jgi:hypothetical protein